MTTVYFVRHAQPDYSNRNDAERELTEKGLRDRKRVTEFLLDKDIHMVLSSPYRRAVDTVKDFADQRGLEIETIDGFRERKVDGVWIEDFNAFCRRQWSDFSYKLAGGESLGEVQRRNVRALEEVLARYRDKNIAVGSHGTALCTILSYFDQNFGYEQFEAVRNLMPWVVKLVFEGDRLQTMEMIDIMANSLE